MRALFLGALALIMACGILAAQPSPLRDGRTTGADSSGSHDGIIRLDTNRFTIEIEGQSRSARAVAYVIDGQVYIQGRWQRDSTARLGPDGIISSCMIRLPGTVGEHRIVVDSLSRRGGEPSTGLPMEGEYDTTHATMFSAMYTGKGKGGKAFTIYRGDWNGGSGEVNVTSMADDVIRGSFTIDAYSLDAKGDRKRISGRFELPVQSLMGDNWVTTR
ncbi:MAG: hypothetical protein JST22_17300 [Bacteroidetes bacterium]|nr:hypothetical protein [Bacteroidota bacterium]